MGCALRVVGCGLWGVAVGGGGGGGRGGLDGLRAFG